VVQDLHSFVKEKDEVPQNPVIGHTLIHASASKHQTFTLRSPTTSLCYFHSLYKCDGVCLHTCIMSHHLLSSFSLCCSNNCTLCIL